MVTAGIIAEYNPFHSGHQYHIEETRRLTGADYILVVMSGDFVQRGEPAAADKYFRTKMALAGGADVVIELPVIYASASAEYFASAGVRLLHNLHCVDYLSFGSEWAEKKEYELLARVLIEEPPEFQKALKKALKTGKNFPAARSEAMKCISGIDEKLLKQPNHILGIEYMKSLRRLHSSICPITVRRQGAGYHNEDMKQEHPSATALRKELRTCRRQNTGEIPKRLQDALGITAEEFFIRYMDGDTVDWDDLMPFLDYRILMDEQQLPACFGMDEEMAARLTRLYSPGKSFQELMERLHTKRLTDAAWRRSLLHALLHIKKTEWLKTAANVPVPYARILGFSEKAAPLIKKIRAESVIPLIQKPAKAKKLLMGDEIAEQMFLTDIRAADFYEQIAAAKAKRNPVSEWIRQQIVF